MNVIIEHLFLRQVIHMPANLVGSYPKDALEAGATGVIGHYTQIVWADTSEVGCGYIKFFDDKGTMTDVSNVYFSFTCLMYDFLTKRSFL